MINNYKQIPVGRAHDFTNQILGDFHILYRTEPYVSNGQACWVCQCQRCQKYILKTANSLKTSTNHCDCRDDLTGQKFGRWTVLYECKERTHNRGKIYHCKCQCGNEKDVPAETLRRGESQSCGCLAKEKAAEIGRRSRIDITGQRFGKLIALYPIYSEDKNKHTKWHCKCDCGNEVDIDLGNLRQGFSKSCGCTISNQEENIIKLLIKYAIPFNYQYKFNSLSDKTFDFYINKQYIIEFDGQQHFFATGTGWDTLEHFERTRNSDLIKNKYCFENNIPLIRIPYNEEYTIDDLKLETTRFLLTPENEEQYYART